MKECGKCDSVRLKYNEGKRKYLSDPVNRSRHNARQAVRLALSSKKMVKGPCEACGTEQDIQAHHTSYDKENWLNVTWLCKKHHLEEHKRMKLSDTL